MKRAIKWFIGLGLLFGLLALLIWAFIEGRSELAREREREMPIKVPPKVSRPPGGEGQNVVTLNADEQRRANLAAAPAQPSSHSPETKAYGRVLDPTPLVAIHKELLTAEIALTNSAAQVQRTRTLFDEDQNATRRALEGAEARFRTDEVNLAALKQRLRLEWGDAAGKLGESDRAKLISDLVAGKRVILRVDLLPGEGQIAEAPAAARFVVAANEGAPIPATVLSSAPLANTDLQGIGFLLMATGTNQVLRPGVAVTAFLEWPGAGQSGVIVPPDSIVRFGGASWVYIQATPDTFTRRQVQLTTPSESGWFIKDGIQPGEKLVVAGGQVLLSEELKARISVGDEGGQEVVLPE